MLEALAFGKGAITISKLSGVGGGVLRMGDGVSPHAAAATAAEMEWGD